MIDYDKFLAALKRARLNAKLPQKRMAAAIGLERSNYTRKEKGKSEITVREMLSINELLGVNWPQLLGEAEPDPMLMAIHRVIRSLPREEQKAVLTIAETLLRNVVRHEKELPRAKSYLALTANTTDLDDGSDGSPSQGGTGDESRQRGKRRAE